MAVLIALAKGSHIVGVASNDGSKLVGVLTQGQLFQQITKKVLYYNFICDLPHFLFIYPCTCL